MTARLSKTALLLSVPLLVVIVIALFSYSNTQKVRSTNEQRTISQSIMEDNATLLSLVTNAETSQRGFLLTGKEQYYKSYNQAISAISPLLERFEAVTTQQPDQVEHLKALEPLVSAKLNELSAVINLSESKKLPGTPAVPNIENGKILMDKVRAGSAIIGQASQTRLSQLVMEEEKRSSRFELVSVLGSTLLLMFLFFSGITIYRGTSLQGYLYDQVKASQKLFKTTLAGIADAVIATDALAKITFINPAAQKLTGWTEHESSGVDITKVFPIINENTHMEVGNPLKGVLKVGGTDKLIKDTNLISKTGREIPIDDSAAALRDENGKLVGAVLVFRDISARRQAEHKLSDVVTALKKSNEGLQSASKKKDEFLAMLAHELRNPLAPIRNALEILKQGGAGEKAEKELQIVMDRQLQKVVRLVDDLLDVSRITRGMITLKTDQVDLGLVISQTVEGMRDNFEACQHKISLSPSQEKVFVKGDAVRLEQVIYNLLMNACKYTNPGGLITIKLESEIDKAIIRITDNGVGISPELLPHIFDLFVQADRSLDRTQGGLGIGLTLVRRLVELQGGTVEAKSQGLKMGSEFTVHLPAIPATEVVLPVVPSVVPPVASRDALLSKHHILVIEDNVDAAKTTQMLLELKGYKVQVAFDGPSGIKEAQTFEPEAIILDIGLPGMNGYEVARDLRKLPGTKYALLIALSGYGQAEDFRKSKEAGFDHHLVKPVDIDKLQALMSAHFNGSLLAAAS